MFQIEEDETEIRRMSGSSIPDLFVSEGESIRLVFHSDGSVTNTGFQLRYKSKQSIDWGLLFRKPTYEVTKINRC